MILCAGFGTRLYPLTKDRAKPLLPVAGKPIVEHLVDQLAAHVDAFVVVSNHRFYDAFVAWAAGRAHVLDDSATTNETRLGAVQDLALALRESSSDGPALVAAGDNLFRMAFDVFFDDYHKKPRTLVLRYREPSIDKCRQTGIAEINAEDGRIVKLWEKPDEPPTRWACPALYILEPEAIEALGAYIAEHPRADALGGFIGWLAERSSVYTHEMHGSRLDVGDLDVSVRSDHVAESRKAREPWCIPPEERSTKEARDGDRQKRGDIEIIGKAALVGVGCAGGGVGMAT